MDEILKSCWTVTVILWKCCFLPEAALSIKGLRTQSLPHPLNPLQKKQIKHRSSHLKQNWYGGCPNYIPNRSLMKDLQRSEHGFASVHFFGRARQLYKEELDKRQRERCARKVRSFPRRLEVFYFPQRCFEGVPRTLWHRWERTSCSLAPLTFSVKSNVLMFCVSWLEFICGIVVLMILAWSQQQSSLTVGPTVRYTTKENQYAKRNILSWVKSGTHFFLIKQNNENNTSHCA